MQLVNDQYGSTKKLEIVVVSCGGRWKVPLSCRKSLRSMKSTFVVILIKISSDLMPKWIITAKLFATYFWMLYLHAVYWSDILNRLEIIHDHLRVNMEYYCGQTVRTFVWFYSELTATSFRRNFIDQRST